jgi:methylmalonyl-CoA mutase, N-terminal domain
VNKFQSNEQQRLNPFKIDPELEAQQIERLRRVRAGRSASSVEAFLASLEAAARSSDNLMPHILNACREHVTVGEISSRLRKVFGEYRESF